MTQPPLLLTILAKLMLTGAVCLFTELCNTLTVLHLFYKHRHDIANLSNMSRTSTTNIQINKHGYSGCKPPPPPPL